MIIRQVWFRSYNLQHAQGVSITQHYSVFSRVHCRPHTWWHYPLVTLWPAMNIVTSQAQRLNSQSQFFLAAIWNIIQRGISLRKKTLSIAHKAIRSFWDPFFSKHFPTFYSSAFLSVGIGGNQGVLIVWALSVWLWLIMRGISANCTNITTYTNQQTPISPSGKVKSKSKCRMQTPAGSLSGGIKSKSGDA